MDWARKPVLTSWILCTALWACDVGEDVTRGEVASADSTATDSTSTDSLEQAEKTRVVEAVPVETARVMRGKISSFLPFNSTLETEAAVEIYPRGGGVVKALKVEEGDRVESGEALLRIDDDELSLTARESEVNLRHLEGGFKRTEEMFQRKLLSQQDYESARFELEQARLQFQRAQLALEHAVVRAPFSGVISARHIQVGSRVEPGTKLFALVKLDDMLARVFVPGRYLKAIQKGQKAFVSSEFLEDMHFDGWVKRISPVVDSQSGTFKVTIGLEESGEHLRPGIFVNVQIVTDTHERAVLVPKEAVLYDGEERYVYVVQDSTASRILLDAGFENSDFVEALSLVKPDIPVIVVGQNGLKDGARVKIVNQEEVPAAGGRETAEERN